MKKNLKNIIAIVILMGLVIWGISNYSHKNAGKTDANVGINVGNEAPDFTLNTVNGDKVQLSSLKGKKVVLNFWATWCPPCQFETPELVKYYNENKDKNITILGIDISTTESNPANVPAFISKFKMTYPVLVDPTGKVLDRYQVKAFPTTIIVDTKGIIQFKHEGALDSSTLQSIISQIN